MPGTISYIWKHVDLVYYLAAIDGKAHGGTSVCAPCVRLPDDDYQFVTLPVALHTPAKGTLGYGFNTFESGQVLLGVPDC